MSVSLKPDCTRSKVSASYLRACNTRRFGDFPHNVDILYMVSPKAAIDAPLWGVPRKQTPIVAGAIAFRCVGVFKD